MMKILMINPPANIIQKPDFGELWGTVKHTFTTDNILVHAINHGILSISSYLEKNGHEVEILDLSYDSRRSNIDASVFERLVEHLNNNLFDIVGISSQSGYDYLESLECANIVKKIQPNIVCVIGGQHAGFLEEIPLKECDSLDVVIKGEGEAVFLALCNGSSCSDIPGITYREGANLVTNAGCLKPVDLSELRLNYSLYPNYFDFAPIVEESRGCPYDCNFCTNRQIYPKGIRYKQAEQIYEELIDVLHLWGDKAKNQMIIFSAAQFGHNIENTLRLAKMIEPLEITWTAEFRVDSQIVNHLDVLYASGLRLMALGLESADESTLKMMNKTSNPRIYLKKCEELLEKARNFEHLVARLNLMFYIGENSKTITNTLRFLLNHKNDIDAIYITPVYFNPGTKIMENNEDISKKYGTILHLNEYWRKRHLYFCDPSVEFKFEELIVFSSILEKIFSSNYGWEVSESTHFLKEE